MSWSVIEIDESGRVTIRRGGTLAGKTEAETMPEPEPKLVTSWQECVRNHPWPSGDNPEHCYPIETNTQPIEPEPKLPRFAGPLTEPEPKPKLVVWRRCVRMKPGELDDKVFYVAWHPSGHIPEHWYPIEAQSGPIETVKHLPEGQEP
jgi:hypothetical protein